MTPPGIDPGTVRLVAHRLNHYATPRTQYKYIFIETTNTIYGVTLRVSTRSYHLQVGLKHYCLVAALERSEVILLCYHLLFNYTDFSEHKNKLTKIILIVYSYMFRLT